MCSKRTQTSPRPFDQHVVSQVDHLDRKPHLSTRLATRSLWKRIQGSSLEPFDSTIVSWRARNKSVAVQSSHAMKSERPRKRTKTNQPEHAKNLQNGTLLKPPHVMAPGGPKGTTRLSDEFERASQVGMSSSEHLGGNFSSSTQNSISHLSGSVRTPAGQTRQVCLSSYQVANGLGHIHRVGTPVAMAFHASNIYQMPGTSIKIDARDHHSLPLATIDPLWLHQPWNPGSSELCKGSEQYTEILKTPVSGPHTQQRGPQSSASHPRNLYSQACCSNVNTNLIDACPRQICQRMSLGLQPPAIQHGQPLTPDASPKEQAESLLRIHGVSAENAVTCRPPRSSIGESRLHLFRAAYLIQDELRRHIRLLWAINNAHQTWRHESLSLRAERLEDACLQKLHELEWTLARTPKARPQSLFETARKFEQRPLLSLRYMLEEYVRADHGMSPLSQGPMNPDSIAIKMALGAQLSMMREWSRIWRSALPAGWIDHGQNPEIGSCLSEEALKIIHGINTPDRLLNWLPLPRRLDQITG